MHKELRNIAKREIIGTAEQPGCPRMQGLPDEALAEVAGYFQALSEPTRLQILNLLRAQERSVGELAQLCGCSSANISRHLGLLTQHGLVSRESRCKTWSCVLPAGEASIWNVQEFGRIWRWW